MALERMSACALELQQLTQWQFVPQTLLEAKHWQYSLRQRDLRQLHASITSSCTMGAATAAEYCCMAYSCTVVLPVGAVSSSNAVKPMSRFAIRDVTGVAPEAALLWEVESIPEMLSGIMCKINEEWLRLTTDKGRNER